MCTDCWRCVYSQTKACSAHGQFNLYALTSVWEFRVCPRVITTSQYHRQVFTPKHGPAIIQQQPQPQQQVPPQYATVTDEKMVCMWNG